MRQEADPGTQLQKLPGPSGSSKSLTGTGEEFGVYTYQGELWVGRVSAAALTRQSVNSGWLFFFNVVRWEGEQGWQVFPADTCRVVDCTWVSEAVNTWDWYESTRVGHVPHFICKIIIIYIQINTNITEFRDPSFKCGFQVLVIFAGLIVLYWFVLLSLLLFLFS